MFSVLTLPLYYDHNNPVVKIVSIALYFLLLNLPLLDLSPHSNNYILNDTPESNFVNVSL